MEYRLSDTINELHRVFNILNDYYFNSELDSPIITIQEDKPNICGSFMTEPTWFVVDDESKKFYEININPLCLDRDIDETIAVLLHEMVHYYNEIKGVKDCTKNGKHNKKFKESAEQVDLIVNEDDYSDTSASDTLKDFIHNEIQPNIDCFKLYMAYEMIEKDVKPRKKTQFKYICPKCGMVAKAKAELNIVCGACNTNLEMEEVEENEDCE